MSEADPHKTANDADEAANASPHPADVVTIDGIIDALYDTISGAAGEQRDLRRFRSLFLPGARLIPTAPNPAGGTTAQVLDVEGYLERVDEPFKVAGFYEREAARRTDRYGNIAHVFSTYESRRAEDDPTPFNRGINSIQLLRDGARWWVVTIFWDFERPDNPVPERYLPHGAAGAEPGAAAQ